MPEQRKVQCCASVDRPYASVRNALHRLPLASAAAASVDVHSVCDQENVAGLPPVTRVTLGCQHASRRTDHADAEASLVSSAEIYASARSAAETQLEIEGHVVRPSGAPIDFEGERVAGACLRTLLESIIEDLRRDIDSTTDGGARKRFLDAA